MPSTDDAHKLHVYVRNSKGELKRFGRVRATVFHPNEPRVVGLVIKRPDALLMVKRKERFAAIDRIEPVEGGISVIDARGFLGYRGVQAAWVSITMRASFGSTCPCARSPVKKLAL